MPGLLGVILQMTMVMMTSIALTREIERGTMENLLAMPANGFEIMLGKVLPFFIVGAVQVTVILSAARFLFHVPFVGNLAMLLSGVLVFVLAMVLLGYTFSTLARSQMQAMQLTFFFLLPSILMSGFMFPFHGMPDWAQDLGSLLPMTHFLRVVRAVMLKGANWSEIGFEFALLARFRARLLDPGAAEIPAHARLTGPRLRAPGGCTAVSACAGRRRRCRRGAGPSCANRGCRRRCRTCRPARAKGLPA